jgi:hypothetical protein
MMLAWNMIICNSPESKSNIIESSVYVHIQRVHRIYLNSERIQILHTCYFSISLSAAGIDGRLRTASISPVREQPPHDQWLPPQLLPHENSLLQIFPVPDPDLARSAVRRTRFQPRGHVLCAAPAALWYSKISVGELEQELEEQWGEKQKVTWTRYATWQPRWQSNNRDYPAKWSAESSP